MISAILNFLPAAANNQTSGVGAFDITLVTHGTVSTLVSLLGTVGRWHGPVSAAIFVRSLSSNAVTTATAMIDHFHRCPHTVRTEVAVCACVRVCVGGWRRTVVADRGSDCHRFGSVTFTRSQPRTE